MSGGRPYRAKHKPVTSTVTNDEHAALTAIAAHEGLPVTTKATMILREFLARQKQTEAA